MLAMVTVAVIGAGAAFRGAVTEQETAALVHQLTQGQLFELAMRERTLMSTIGRDPLESRKEELLRDGRRFIDAAAAARRSGNSGFADWLEVRAQEEFAARRSVLPYRREFPDLTAYKPWRRPKRGMPPKPAAIELTAEQVVEQNVAGELAGFGFPTRWRDPRYGRESGDGVEGCDSPSEIGAQGDDPHPQKIWCRLEHEIEVKHERLRSFALAIVGLVVALVLFTAADASIKARWIRLRALLLGIGVDAAVATVIGVIFRVEEVGWWRCLPLALTAGTLLAGFAFWLFFAALERLGWLSAGADEGYTDFSEFKQDRSTFPGLTLPHNPADGFARFVVLLVAVTVLMSAAAGWRYSVADTRADAASQQARNDAQDMAKRSGFLATIRASAVGEFAASAEYRARLAATRQRIGRFPRDEDELHAAHLADDRLRRAEWDWARDAPKIGAADDPAFPRRFIWQYPQVPDGKTIGPEHVRTYNAWEPLALSDAESRFSRDLRHSATWFLATLTLFAIALYLFGQALGMGRSRSAYVLVTAGVAFVLAGAVIGWHTHLPSAPASSESLSEDSCAQKASPLPPLPPDIASPGASPWRRAAYYYAIGTVLREYASDSGDTETALKYLGCAAALDREFADSQLQLARAKARARSSDFGEPYLSLPPTGRDLIEVIGAEGAARDLFKQNTFQVVPASLLGNIAFDDLLDALSNRRQGALAASAKAADAAISAALSPGAVDGDSLPMYRFNLGLVRLARGEVEDARTAYRDALAPPAYPPDELRASALTDLETLAALRCGLSRGPDDVPAQCARGLRIREMKEIVMGRHPDKTTQPLSLPEGDFTISVTAGRVSAVLRGLDPAADELSLVWYKVEPNRHSWRALQRLSGVVDAPAADGRLLVQRSHIGQYLKDRACLASGDYQAELYAHGTLIATKPARDQIIPLMERSDLHDLNMRLCLPRGWTTDGLTLDSNDPRLVYRAVTPEGKVAALFRTFYRPRGSAAAGSDDEDAIVAGVLETLAKEGTARQSLVPWKSLDPQSLSIPPGSRVYRGWRTKEGEVHIAIAFTDAMPADQLWQMLESVETIYPEEGG